MAGSNMVEHKLRLLIETELDEKQKQQVGKQLKNILEGAAIGFDEAETKKNLTPIIRMIQKLFDKAEMKFDADELIGMPSREALQKVANITANQFQDAFEKALAKSGGVKIDFGNIDMSGIVAPLEKLTQELSDISEKVSNSTKKSVIDIEESVKRLNNIKPKKINSKKPVEQGELPVSNVEATTGDIEKLLSDIDNGTKTSEKLTKLYQHYKESVENDDPWEVQYQHLVRYVHRYETMTKKYLSKNIEQNPELQELYEILAPKAGAAKISLQHFVDMSRGNELSEYKNHPWARESTLKKVEQTLRNGISVKGSVGDYDNSERSGQPAAPTQAEEGDGKQLNAKVPPKESGSKNFEKNAKIKVGAEQAALELIRQRRAEAEAIAEAERKAAAEAKKAATKKVFRVIYEPEEPDDRSREEILAPYGAEYWTDSKTVAETYAEMGDNPVILEGEVVSNKPFIIDAGGHKWNAFGLMRTVEENPEDPSSPIMTDLRDKFPELFKRIDAGEFGRNYGEIQAELNKTIKALGMGYDAVVTRNVIDAADADSFREKSTTYAVLDDGILHVEAAIIGTADEDGLYDFDGKAKKENIPEYYKMPAAPSESMDVSASIPKIEYSADEIQKMIEGLAVLEQKIQHLGEGASIDQSNLPDELARYQRLIQEISSSTIVESEDDRQRLIELREEALRLATALQSFQLNDSDIEGQASAYGITKDASKALMDTEETAKKLRNELEAILRFQFDEIYDALPDDEQKKLQDYGSEWNEISRNIVAGLQSETTAHRNNADAIEDETSAQDKLNEEKKESRSSNTDNGAPAATGTSPDTAGSPNGTVPHDSIQTEELRALLNSITYNVKVVQDVESTEDDKIAIDTEALKSVLDNIIYNVKITHDDNDKQANRIAIDESVLESTLKRVFANVLSPQIEQNDSEPKNEPWAREDTLSNTIKGVLDQIQTNTSKIGAAPQTPANDSDSILSQISKNVLEINGKIVKGTKAQNKDTAKTQKVPAGRDAQILAERIATQKLSLAKFKTELETSGRMTEDVAKKIRGLAISLGMVKDSKGLTKWGEKFKQQKLNVGITDIENKEEQQIEKDALKEKENRIKTLNKLYQEYGVLVERAAAAEGHFKEQLQDEIRDKDAEIWALRDSFDDITPEMFAGFDEAFERGKKIESTKQYEALSKRSDADEIARLKNIEGLEKEIGKLRANADAATNAGVKSALEAEIKLREELIELQKQGLVMDADAETYYRQKFANDTKRAKQNATQETKERKTAFNDAKRMAQREAMPGKTGSAVGRAETTWLSAAGIEGDLPAGFLAEIDEYYNKLDALRKKHQELKNSEMISDTQKKELIEQTMSVNKMTEEIGELVSEYQRLSGDNSTVIGTNTLGTDAGLSAYEQQLKQTVMTATNGKAQIKNFDAATKTLTYTVKTGKNEFTEYTAAVRRADGALVSVQGATKRTETFIEATTRKMKELTSYFSGMAVFNQVGQELRRGIQYVREIDDALVELRKVTDETDESYDKFLRTAAKTGSVIGATISEVTEATATFSKLGYDMEMATEMAESAIVYKNVGDNIASAEDAADSIISTLKGFRLESSETMRIVDRFNEVGNRFAITSQGIGEALRLSASALSEGGNSLDESIGLITAANEVVNDPSSVGTALKTLTLRLRGSKTELEEMGEDVTDMATTTSQLQAKLLALTGGQVDIMANPTAFKNSTQILREMADAWEDMTDIQRASALELMGGKRQANVLSALIQNFDTVEDAIEASANSAGSALKENEIWLDSISGKVSQFNNAMQAMWSNTLDSDVVKGFVALGTEIIKIIDKIGLLNTALIALATYSMIKHQMGPITFFKELVGLIPKGVKGLQAWIQSMQASDAATVAGIKTKVADTAATDANTAANTANAASSVVSGAAEDKDTADTIENTAATAADTAATDANTAANTANAASSVVSGAATGTAGAGAATGVVGASFTGLAAAVPYILGAVAAIAAIVVVFKLVTKDINELKEELQESQSEFDNTKSEIESINSELETTQERIAELLAKPSLSFVEQEELKKLQQQNALLERNLKLQEMILAQKEAELVADTRAYLSAEWDGSKWSDKPYAVNGATGIISEDKWYTSGVGAKDALDVAIDKYAKIKQTSDALAALALEWDDNSSDGNAKLISSLGLDNLIYAGADDKSYVLEQQKAYDAALVQIASGISSVLDNPQYSGLSYGMSSEIDAFLDEWNAYQYKFQEAQGLGGKSSAIASVFDDTSSDSIKKLKKDLSEIAGDDTLDVAKKQKNALDLVNKAIDSTSGEYDRLKTSMDIIGITADEVARYFVQLSEVSDSSTVEGITAQYQKGVEALGKYKGVATDIISEFTDLDGTVEQIAWGSLFDNEGEAIDTQISKVLQGANETTRAEFARIAKSVNEGTMSIETAMSSFSGSGLVAVSKLIEESFGELNKSVFKGLEDEISGFIDTFSEFSAALEDVASSMDLLHTAQEQMNSSGQISLKTALELVESTDQWNKVLTVENGKIKLNAEAEDILAQTKLNTVKANLAEAKASIQNQLAQLGAADATLLSAEASDITTEAYTIYTNAMNSYTASIAGFGAALDALVNGRIFGDDGIIGSFQSAYDATKEVTTYENNTNIAALRQQLAEVDKMEDFFEVVDTTPEFKNNYDFDETPGDKYGEDKDSKDDETRDAFQKEMDYWENLIQANQAKYTQIQNEIDLLEAQGKRAGADYYKEQIKFEKERLDLLKQQQEQARLRLQSLESEKGSEAWWEAAHIFNDLEDEIDGAILSIQELNNAIIDGSHGFVDDIQDVYDTLTEAQKEYTENGYLSVDTMQSLLELEPKYLDLLVDENGNLNLNKQALQDVARARIEDLSIKQQQAIIDRALQLATDGSRQAIIQQIAVMETAATVGEHWLTIQMRAIAAAIRAKVAMGELTQAEGDAFISGTASQLRAVQSVAKSSLNNLNKALAGEDEDESFQKTMDYWDNRIQANQAKYEQLQNEIDLLESQGRRAGEEYYNQQINLENERMGLLEQQRDAALDQLDTLEEGSDEWWDLAHTLNDIESELDDVTASIVSLQDAIGDIDTYKFEEFNSRLGDTTSKLETIRGLIAPDGAEDWFDDQGQWTEDGVAVLGSYIQELEIYRNGLKNTRSELEKYKDAYNSTTKAYYANLGIHSEQEYYDKVQELTEQQYDYTQSISDAERSVVDMYESNIDAVEKYTQTLVDSYNDYIDSVKEALDAERD